MSAGIIITALVVDEHASGNNFYQRRVVRKLKGFKVIIQKLRYYIHICTSDTTLVRDSLATTTRPRAALIILESPE